MIKIQTQPFDIGQIYEYCANHPHIGAVNVFVGRVRDLHGNLQGFALEHYPQMAEKCLYNIATEAMQKFQLLSFAIVHRYGQLQAGDQIVCCAAGAPHRAAAIDGCTMMMDYLKTQAPFWKNESTNNNGITQDNWVLQNPHDIQQYQRWNNGTDHTKG